MTLFACAAVLTSAVAFTGCKSDNNEPTKPAEVVKTEFAIALPDNAVGNGPRRMPGATVQKTTNDFQGLANMVLIPFAKADKVESTDPRLGSANIALGTIPYDTVWNASNHSKVYSDVAIPLTTSAFLFYGESAKNASATTPATKAQYGVLTAANIASGAPSGITFSLAPILSGTTASVTASGEGKELIDLLNGVANAQDSESKAWKSYNEGEGDDAGMIAMFETYSSMHALSSNEVLRVLKNLYESLEPLKSAAEPVGTLATNIQTAIKAGITVAGEVGSQTFTWQDGYTGFPVTTHGLPEGAVRIKYDATAFRACTDDEYTAVNQAPLNLFTYPSSLWYFANSTIKTANESKKTLYEGANDWNTILAAYTGASAVNSVTRSVVIKDTIQYAVARLDVSVALSNTELEDKAGQKINCTSGFPVTAVLVGGQKKANFKFEPTGSDVYTIYDNVMTTPEAPLTMTATTTRTGVNSTLVLETENGDSKDVKIAVEFTNASGHDFQGIDGLVPAGGKFYLIATLPSAAAIVTGKKVFKQDYTTTATLTVTSLAKAYNTIPDLRTPKLELGMTVDLNWKSGHTYDINFD